MTFYVSDGVNTVESEHHALDRTSPPPPQLAAVPTRRCARATILRFTLQGSDADGEPVTYSSAEPAGEMPRSIPTRAYSTGRSAMTRRARSPCRSRHQ